MKLRHALAPLLIVGAAALLLSAETQKRPAPPGFRPASPLAQEFLKQPASTRLAVFPTVVRTRQGTEHSLSSQQAVLAFLKERKWGVPEPRQTKLDPGEPQGRFQFDLFQSTLKHIGANVVHESGADYFILLELLLTPTPSGEIAVGGIQVYVIDKSGNNAFSFLLNSHHEAFVQAKLITSDTTAEGRQALVLRGTAVALEAFAEQIRAAK